MVYLPLKVVVGITVMVSKRHFVILRVYICSLKRWFITGTFMDDGVMQLHDGHDKEHHWTSARKQGCVSPFPSSSPCGCVVIELHCGLSSIKIRDRGGGVLAMGYGSCPQVGDQQLGTGEPAPWSWDKERPEKAGSNLFSCC